jgi:hypothetical protein
VWGLIQCNAAYCHHPQKEVKTLCDENMVYEGSEAMLFAIDVLV